MPESFERLACAHECANLDGAAQHVPVQCGEHAHSEECVATMSALAAAGRDCTVSEHAHASTSSRHRDSRQPDRVLGNERFQFRHCENRRKSSANTCDVQNRSPTRTSANSEQTASGKTNCKLLQTCCDSSETTCGSVCWQKKRLLDRHYRYCQAQTATCTEDEEEEARDPLIHQPSSGSDSHKGSRERAEAPSTFW